MEDVLTRKARSVYRKLLEAIEKNGWKCKENDEHLAAAYAIKTDEGDSFEFMVMIDGERQLVCLNTFTLMSFDESRKKEGAVAVSALNYLLADGCFNYHLQDGAVTFRQAISYRGDTNLSVEAIQYMLSYALFAVGSFTAKLKLVNDGKAEGKDIPKLCEDAQS